MPGSGRLTVDTSRWPLVLLTCEGRPTDDTTVAEATAWARERPAAAGAPGSGRQGG
jgi:hypothetical protein